MKTKGPTVTIRGSCLNCEFCRSESYTCQGDSGSDVYCVNPEVLEAGKELRFIADTNWATPKWCPFLADAIQQAVTSGE